MSDLVVVDTSVFVQFLRGDSNDALSVLVLNNQVLISPVVRLELLAGVDKFQMKILERLFDSLQQIKHFAPIADCEKLLKKARGSGLYGGLPDLLILADCLTYKSPLLSYDEKMKRLAKKLGVKVVKL